MECACNALVGMPASVHQDGWECSATLRGALKIAMDVECASRGTVYAAKVGLAAPVGTCAAQTIVQELATALQANAGARQDMRATIAQK
jgi:hypothetical protein